MRTATSLSALAVTVALTQLSACGGGEAMAQTPVFTLSSPDLATGSFASKFIANGFGSVSYTHLTLPTSDLV